MELEGCNVLVVGLARTGVAAARFLLARQARVSCSDLKTAQELGEAAAVLEDAGCRLRLGGHRREDFVGSDLIVISPGVPLTIPPLQEAVAAGVELIGEVELAFRHMTCPIVGVTGTNGKTTTVQLIASMLEKGAIPHWVGGNIGRPLTEFLLSRTAGDDMQDPRVIVAELSSFQLETIVHFRPWMAVWTNLSTDHLDRYPNIEAYAEAKARIFSRQTPRDYAVIPERDPWLETKTREMKARVLRFGHAEDSTSDICLKEGQILFRWADAGEQECYETSRVRVPGKHNLENMMAALAAARLCGAPPGAIQEAIDSFEGLEHRVEYVGESRGVRFYNDSKATTVDSVVRALECFDEPVLLLAGGRDKGGSLEPLRESLKRTVRRVFPYGEAAGRIERELDGATEMERAVDLDEAMAKAWQAARPGEVILLSPACSSFDMFQDYEDRGRRFKGLVKEIAQEADPAVE